MKKIIFTIMLFVGVLTTSCQTNLLDTIPSTAVSSETMWTTEPLADYGVNAVYAALRQDYTGLNLWYLDQEGFTGQNRDNTDLTSGTITPSSSIFSNYWKQNYEGIRRANDAIANLPKAPIAATKLGRLIAESKFLRAWYYYNLNQVYRGVPLYLEPVDFSKATKGRSTEIEVWNQIITDLTDCVNETNLPNLYAKGNSNYGRITKAAAYALRGKVYMWIKDYVKAEADLRAVTTLGPTLYTGTYKDLFKVTNEQCPEMIFSVQNIAVNGYGSSTQMYLGSRVAFGSDWNNYLPHPDFVESFEEASGKAFNWEDYLPGYNSMTPKQRLVYFLRDGLTAAEITTMTNAGCDMTKYLSTGNEARVLNAYNDRDPRLRANIITPYSTFYGAIGSTAYTYTLRWPYRGGDTSAPFDLRTDYNSRFMYLWRKWVYEGVDLINMANRTYGSIDQPLIRYADVVLMLAEAINEQGFKAEAVGLVNSVRSRAGVISLQSTNSSLPTYVNDQNNMRERIRNERRWELCLEGINYFDEMRWKTLKDKKFYRGNTSKEISGVSDKTYTWLGDYMYLWAIPAAEVQRLGTTLMGPNQGWIY
jgi:hypothetical protein